MRLLLSLSLFFPSLSLAAPNWEKVDSRSETTYKVSNYTLLGGIVVSLGGSFSSQEAVRVSGDLLTGASIATMTGSSLRQRRSIVERGATLSSAWGYTSWGLQAASAGLGVSLAVYADQHGIDTNNEPTKDEIGPIIGMSLGSLACTIGAILTASKQHKENAFKRGMIGRARYDQPTSHLAMSLSPFFTEEGTAGLGATAIF